MKIVTSPKLKIDDELIAICIQIREENKTDSEWSEIASSDMFQSSKYCGGYDEIEQDFWFSYYDPNNKEWWFELPLSQLGNIIAKKLRYLDIREAN